MLALNVISLFQQAAEHESISTHRSHAGYAGFLYAVGVMALLCLLVALGASLTAKLEVPKK